VETIGSKRSYALIWCMPNNDDDDSVRGQVWSVYYTYIKGIRLRVAEIWSYEVYSKLPPADILDLINWKWCLSIRRPRKLQPGTKHEGDRMMRCRVMAI